jgi:hypothetical protein
MPWPVDLHAVERVIHARSGAVERLFKLIERARLYVEDAVMAAGGIDNCEIGLRADLEALDEALGKEKSR